MKRGRELVLYRSGRLLQKEQHILVTNNMTDRDTDTETDTETGQGCELIKAWQLAASLHWVRKEHWACLAVSLYTVSASHAVDRTGCAR